MKTLAWILSVMIAFMMGMVFEGWYLERHPHFTDQQAIDSALARGWPKSRIIKIAPGNKGLMGIYPDSNRSTPLIIDYSGGPVTETINLDTTHYGPLWDTAK